MDEKYIDIALRFTNAYKKYYNSPPEIREVMCLKEYYPHVLEDLRETDIFAGRCEEINTERLAPVAFSPKKNSQIGYFASMPLLRKYEKEFPACSDEIKELKEFWKSEATFVKIRDSAPQDVHDYLFPCMMGLDGDGYMRKSKPGKPLGSGFISGSFDTRIAGVMPDFDALLSLGITGLYEKIEKYEKINGENDFYRAARIALDIVKDTLKCYSKQAEKLIKTADDDRRKSLEQLKEILDVLQIRKPETLREAMQLTAIFTVLTEIDNFGRMDVYFGDFLVRDMERGVLCEEEAVGLISAFWDFISENCGSFDSRVIIGGKCRRNEKNADRFALLAMEATLRRHEIKPVLTLRLSKTQNPALYEKGLELISKGCIYPTLYNDDRCIEGFMKSMNLPYEDAADYAPLGCGEIVIAGKSIGSPNSTFRVLKGLEAALHNGRDAVSGALIGVPTGEIEKLDSFEKLHDALLKQLDARLAIDAKVHRHNREATAKEAAFVMISLVMDDCIERGAGIFHGGVRYFGANLEGFGVTNTINSLATIKKLVYDEKKYTLENLVHMLDADFEGYENERRIFMNVDKFGNNKSWVDDLKIPIENFVNKKADEYGRENGFHYCTVASVNPGGIIIGPSTAASADGRKCGKPFALGNSPMPGTDTSGLTSALISASKADSANGGYVTNLHISKNTFSEHPQEISKLIETYFDIGGLQLNINCFSKGELEKAMKNPEEYKSIIVRVSGYSARFIDLDEVTQKHIMERTLY